MTAVILTPQPATASVVVDITGVPAGQTVASITRTDANGTNAVRTRTGQTPSAGEQIVVDYEAALTGSLRYDVVASGGSTAAGSTSLEGLVALPQLQAVQLPQLYVEPQLVTGYGSRRASSAMVHDIIGREDPVVIGGPSKLRTGTLDVWCASYDDARAAELVAASGYLLMLRTPGMHGMDMWFTATATDLRPEPQRTAGGWRWTCSVSYTEIRSPRLPLLGDAGWTFDDVVAGYPTFAGVRTAFATFGELAIG